MQWNEPSRSDHYLMLVAAEVRRKFLQDPNAVKLADLKIPFVEVEAVAVTKPVDEELPPGFPRRLTKADIAVAEAKIREAQILMIQKGRRLPPGPIQLKGVERGRQRRGN